MVLVYRDANKFIGMQMTIALRILTSFAAICKFILDCLYVCKLFEFSLEAVFDTPLVPSLIRDLS